MWTATTQPKAAQNSEPEFCTRYGSNIPSSQPTCYAIITRNSNNNNPHATWHVCTICMCKLALHQQNLKKIRVKNKQTRAVGFEPTRSLELRTDSFKQWKITENIFNKKKRHEEVRNLHMQMHGMDGAMSGRLQSNMQSCQTTSLNTSKTLWQRS